METKYPNTLVSSREDKKLAYANDVYSKYYSKSVEDKMIDLDNEHHTIKNNVANNKNNIDQLTSNIVNNTNDITKIKKDIATNKTNIELNKKDINTNTNNINTNTSDISKLKEADTTINNDIKTIKSDIATNKTNISTIKSDIATNKTNINTNKTNINTIKSDIAAIKSDIATNKANITANKTNITANKTNISTNKANITANTNDINKLKEANIDINNNINTIKSNINTNTNDINTNVNDINTNKEAIKDIKGNIVHITDTMSKQYYTNTQVDNKLGNIIENTWCTKELINCTENNDSHKLWVGRIDISKNISNINYFTTITIRLADDATSDNPLKIRILDSEDNFIVDSNNHIIQSDNTNKYVTWYFDPIIIPQIGIHIRFIDLNNKYDYLRVHGSMDDVGITCLGFNLEVLPMCPAIGFNVTPLVHLDLYNKFVSLNV